MRYVPVDGELELLPGLGLVPAPGHTGGTQVVVVGGDVAVWFGELDGPHTEGQLLVRALDPVLVWLSQEHEPWRRPRPRITAALSRRIKRLGRAGTEPSPARGSREPR